VRVKEGGGGVWGDGGMIGGWVLFVPAGRVCSGWVMGGVVQSRCPGEPGGGFFMGGRCPARGAGRSFFLKEEARWFSIW